MDLLTEINNLQKLGGKATLSGLKDQKRKIEEIQHIVAVLDIISKLSDLVETAKFKKLNIQFMELYFGSQDWNEDKIEYVLIDNDGLGYSKSDEKVRKTVIEINQIFGVIEAGEELIGANKSVQTFTMTRSGLKELQNYLLHPKLQIELEKALLSSAVKTSPQTKEVRLLKL